MAVSAVSGGNVDAKGPTFAANFAVAIAAFALGSIALRNWSSSDALYHTVLVTGLCLTGGLLALLLWDVSVRTGRALPLMLAISFAISAAASTIHMILALHTARAGGMRAFTDISWQTGAWGQAVYVLPIGTLAAVYLRNHTARIGWAFFGGLCIASAALSVAFAGLPAYVPNGFLGITRPAYVGVPILWAVCAFLYWQHRHETELKHAMALASVIFLCGAIAAVFSSSLIDTGATIGYLARLVAEVFLLFSLTQIGAADTQRRLEAEGALTALNADLEERVRQRTSELQGMNAVLRAETALREEADTRLQTQLERTDLLNRITRSIAERLDIRSIYQVAIGSLEDRMPAAFACVCTYDPVASVLSVAQVGSKSGKLARELGMSERTQIAVGNDGLARCLSGELVYEGDISGVAFPFPQRLAKSGVRSLVAAPLKIDSDVFAVMLVGRMEIHAFTSTDCEFLHQLSEHVSLAARQAALHSNLQKAYDDLRQTQQAVMQQERLRALGQMASGIAHDINNAISPISLYTASLLENAQGLPERVTNYLETVKRVTNDVAATVARLREFYRERESETAMAPVNLNELVEQVVELTKARWSDMPLLRGVVISLKCEFAPDLPPVMAIAHEIREALTNLVFNAVDALPAGGQITVTTAVVEVPAAVGPGAETRVLLDVTDNGSGMDEATRRRCMEPFFTTKGERGTGLGLAMVYGVVTRHGANIDIESAPGKGTRFRLEFHPADGTAAAAPRPETAGELRPMRLLLIDDDPFVLDSMRTVLELDGHTIAEASDGEAGVAAFRAALESGERFDVVITDLGMPHMDGNQVARTIKGLAPTTPVILLTGWGRRMQTEDDATSHVDVVLGKPPQLEELREALVMFA
jgi:signal transduction histidine kinase